MATALTPLALSLSTSGDDTVPATAADVTGNTVPFPTSGSLYLFVKNGSGSSINVTVASQAATADLKAGHGKTDLVVAVAASTSRSIGPITRAYKDGSGNVNVAYSSVTTVTVKAVVA